MCTENKQVQPGLREMVQHSLQKYRQIEVCSSVFVKNNKLLRNFHELLFPRLYGYLSHSTTSFAIFIGVQTNK